MRANPEEDRFMSLRGLTTLTLAAALLVAASAAAAGTPEQKCQAAKNVAAGKYGACRQKAEAKLATTGDGTTYSASLTKCGTKFTRVWQKTIDKAAAHGATCLDAPLTASDVQNVIVEHTNNIATALSGGGLVDCSALASCQANLKTCEAAQQGERLKTGQTSCYDSSGTVIVCAGSGQDGELQQGLVRSYTDNGDGTITDTRTGLMWEKLSDDGSIHAWDNAYTWKSAFAKVASLNSASFAGHGDWRVPNVNELQSLLDYGATLPPIDVAFNSSCAPGCSVTTCSCTRSYEYWSSTTSQYLPSLAWVVLFTDGTVGASSKTNTDYVRAVRS